MKNKIPKIIYKFFLIFTAILCLSACYSRKNTADDILSESERLIWISPDSAMNELHKIINISELSEEKGALYSLLLSQAMYRSGKIVPPDSLIDKSLKYYSCKSSDSRHITLTYLYKGYICQERGDDDEAVFYFKKAEEAMPSVGDRRIHFLVYTALGRINGSYGHYEIATDYFKKAINLNLSVPVWEAMEGGWVFTPFWMIKNNDMYLEEVRLMYEKLCELIDRMDFKLQCSVYYQIAVRLIQNNSLDRAEKMLIEVAGNNTDKVLRYKALDALADMYYIKCEKAISDSLYTLVLDSCNTPFKASVYRKLYKRSMEEKDTALIIKYMQKYIEQQDLLFSSSSRDELLRIERQYEMSGLKLQNEKYKSKFALGIIITALSVFILIAIVWFGWKLFRKQKLDMAEKVKHDVALLQKKIDSLQESMSENAGENEACLKLISELERQKKEKEIRVRQLELTFRAKNIYLSPDIIEAVQVYLNIIDSGNPEYNPSADRIKLEKWINISSYGWADKLQKKYPSLTNGEKDICYLCFLNVSLDRIALILDIQSRSVERTVYRISRKMNLPQSGKDCFLEHIRNLFLDRTVHHS